MIVATFNTSAFANQVSVFIRDKSEDPHVGMAHAMRFFEMGHFFRVHRRRLIKEEFIRLTTEPDDPVLGARDDIHEALLTALCELPYKGQRRQGPTGYTPTFKLAAVLKRAAELRAEEDSGDTSEQ